MQIERRAAFVHFAILKILQLILTIFVPCYCYALLHSKWDYSGDSLSCFFCCRYPNFG